MSALSKRPVFAAIVIALVASALAAAPWPAFAGGPPIGIKKTRGPLPFFDKPFPRPRPKFDYRLDPRPLGPQLRYQVEEAYSRPMAPRPFTLGRLDIGRYGF